MQIVTSVEAQNNFGRLMNTIPREPVIITKHGKKYAIVLPYDEVVEFGEMDINELSKEARKMYDESKKLDKSAFINF
jgi:prevent-host-death family protein